MPLRFFIPLFLIGLVSCESVPERPENSIPAAQKTYADSARRADSVANVARLVYHVDRSAEPFDESHKDASLVVFIGELKHVVKQRNPGKLMKMVHDSVTVSDGGGEYGKEAFIQYWALDNTDSVSEIWALLEKVISLGGTFDDKDNKAEFRIPSVQASKYQEFSPDPFQTWIIIRPDAKLYAGASEQSPVVRTLRYTILESPVLVDNEKTRFVNVHTLDEKSNGYILKDDAINGASHILILKKRKGHWLIDSFAPYD